MSTTTLPVLLRSMTPLSDSAWLSVSAHARSADEWRLDVALELLDDDDDDESDSRGVDALAMETREKETVE